MMSPKQKAKELVDKFTVVGLQQRNEGIQCAIIAVDEILYVVDCTSPQYDYWENVKEEIKKL